MTRIIYVSRVFSSGAARTTVRSRTFASRKVTKRKSVVGNSNYNNKKNGRIGVQLSGYSFYKTRVFPNMFYNMHEVGVWGSKDLGNKEY